MSILAILLALLGGASLFVGLRRKDAHPRFLIGGGTGVALGLLLSLVAFCRGDLAPETALHDAIEKASWSVPLQRLAANGVSRPVLLLCGGGKSSTPDSDSHQLPRQVQLCQQQQAAPMHATSMNIPTMSLSQQQLDAAVKTGADALIICCPLPADANALFLTEEGKPRYRLPILIFNGVSASSLIPSLQAGALFGVISVKAQRLDPGLSSDAKAEQLFSAQYDFFDRNHQIAPLVLPPPQVSPAMSEPSDE